MSTSLVIWNLNITEHYPPPTYLMYAPLCSLYIQFVVSARVSDWFFCSILYLETSKLVDSIQTGLRWKISLGLSFALEPYKLTTLLKHNLLPAFLHKFETCSSKYNVLSIYTPSSYCQIPKFLCRQCFPRYFHVRILQQVNDTHLHSISYCCFEITQLLRNYHASIYLLENLGLYHTQKVWFHQQNYILPYTFSTFLYLKLVASAVAAGEFCEWV